MALFPDNMIQSAAWKRSTRILPGAVAAALVLLLAWEAASLSWSVARIVTTEPQLPPPAALETGSPDSAAAPGMAQVAALHLFGTATLDAEPAEETIDAPETRLNVKLRGILAAEPPEFSRAIIASGNDEKVYAVGAQLPGGATVRAVQKDRVLINRAGRIEALTLPKNDATSGVSYDTTAPAPDTEAGLGGSSGDAPDLGRIREQIASDPASLAELVRYSPVMENGELRGYRIFPGRDRAQFAQLGLRPGDVVTAINGTPLGDPAQAIEMLNTLSTADSVTLTIDRGGSPQEITLSAQ